MCRSDFLQYTMDTVNCQDTSAISLPKWSVAKRNQECKAIGELEMYRNGVNQMNIHGIKPSTF